MSSLPTTQRSIVLLLLVTRPTGQDISMTATHTLRYLVTVFTLLAAVPASPAPDDHSVLFFSTATVPGGENDIAQALNFTVVVLEPPEWSTLTTEDYKTYRAIVLPDPNCSRFSPSILEPVEANRAVWSPAVTGNMIVIGTDPTFHRSIPGATTLMQQSLEFVTAVKGKTGFYFSLSCYYGDSLETTIPCLDQFGDFRVRGNISCNNRAHIVAKHPALDTLTDEDLSDWGCSVHEVIPQYPTNFAPLAIALNMTGSGSKAFADGSEGIPYIVARGVKVERCGNYELDVGEECDDGNLNDGDGCSSTCRKEALSGKTCDLCIPYPEENKCHNTTSCTPTPFGTMCGCRPGYKTKSASADTSSHWRLKWSHSGHEHRVFVKPGMKCDELCVGATSCAEISIAECKSEVVKA